MRIRDVGYVACVIAGIAAGVFIYDWTKRHYSPFWHTTTILALVTHTALPYLTRRLPARAQLPTRAILTILIVAVLLYPLVRYVL
ncbi:MAG: hypothetical protein ACOY93_04555 [Bacillota bacterium]